jgi:uncharacterized LabA/DUF88 family protein
MERSAGRISHLQLQIGTAPCWHHADNNISYPSAISRTSCSMTTLRVLVDFDNVEPRLRHAGPVSLAILICGVIPDEVLARHRAIAIRLYGGWRLAGTLTHFAQRLLPDIHRNSPTIVNRTIKGSPTPLRVSVELAEQPLGHHITLSNTFVQDRHLRNFKSRTNAIPNCANQNSCGLAQFSALRHDTPCSEPGCLARLGHVFVRNEQKMVDTLIVADIAFLVYQESASDIVVVSADTDMWPGVILATKAHANVLHIYPVHGKATHPLIRATLDAHMSACYSELSI